MSTHHCFKHIDLPGWEEVSSYVLEWTLKNTDFFVNRAYKGWTEIHTQKLLNGVPGINELFDTAGFKITNVSYFLKNNFIVHPPHSHVGHDLARINIPILNCKGTFTKFYESTEIGELGYNAQGHALAQLSSFNNVKEIASCEISVPTILSVKTLHSVVIPPGTVFPRIMISVKVDPDPIYLLIKD